MNTKYLICINPDSYASYWIILNSKSELDEAIYFLKTKQIAKVFEKYKITTDLDKIKNKNKIITIKEKYYV